MATGHHAELMHPGLAGLLARAGERMAARPVEAWNPIHCGTIDIAIDAEGRWHHLGSPIGRPELVRLFASVLRREPDGAFVLVTPAEKLTIRVADAPFAAVEMHAEGAGLDQVLTFRTNVDDVVVADEDHPLRFAVDPGDGGMRPYVRVRGGLEARLTRATAIELAGLAMEHDGRIGVASRGAFFAMPAEE